MNLFKNLVLVSSIGLFAVSCNGDREVKEVRKETVIKETDRPSTSPTIITPVVSPGTTGR